MLFVSLPPLEAKSHFYCAERDVVIEIDGSSHDGKQEYDTERNMILEGLGLTVIHIPADEVIKT